jgi:bifunctional non-homologous end joining protein LigD
MKGYYPSWVKIFKTDRRVKVKDKSADIDWVICNDKATLFYMLGLDALDFHPWAANYKRNNYPDYLVIDLDAPDSPDEKNKGLKKEVDKKKEMDRKNLIKTALACKQYNLYE